MEKFGRITRLRPPLRCQAPQLRPWQSSVSCLGAGGGLRTQSTDSSATSSSSTSSSSSSSIPTPAPSESSKSPEVADWTTEIAAYDPIARVKARRRRLPGGRLPPSRYKFRSPKYFRGPLHPHQPPPVSDPHSRLFVPGPFSLPRLAQTWTSTVSHDLMTLLYAHVPPGTAIPPRPPRLREWDDSSPYHKNRPKRGPRGAAVLPLLARRTTFRNIPTLAGVSVYARISSDDGSGGGGGGGGRSSTKHSEHLHVAGMVIQALTAQRASIFRLKAADGKGGRRGKPVGAGATFRGEMMWHFLGTLTGVVLPRVKEFRGLGARAADRSGNFGIGLPPQAVASWPEISVNYDAYPPRLIPKLDVVLHTTATTDRDGRLLLNALGVPFVAGGARKR